MKPDRWDDQEWAEASAVLYQRAGGRCDVCGHALHTYAVRHHRQRRRVGGDRYSNLILIHPWCHAQVHEQPKMARANGWIVSAYAPDPEQVPVRLRGDKWWTLRDDGGKTPLP